MYYKRVCQQDMQEALYDVTRVQETVDHPVPAGKTGGKLMETTWNPHGWTGGIHVEN